MGQGLRVLFYNGDDDVSEDLNRYKPGVLHSSPLGDICTGDRAKQPKYRISQKLEFGAFSYLVFYCSQKTPGLN